MKKRRYTKWRKIALEIIQETIIAASNSKRIEWNWDLKYWLMKECPWSKGYGRRVFRKLVMQAVAEGVQISQHNYEVENAS